MVDDTTYFSLISEHQISKTGVSYFHAKVANTNHRNIIVGVGSKFIRGV